MLRERGSLHLTRAMRLNNVATSARARSGFQGQCFARRRSAAQRRGFDKKRRSVGSCLRSGAKSGTEVQMTDFGELRRAAEQDGVVIVGAGQAGARAAATLRKVGFP